MGSDCITLAIPSHAAFNSPALFRNYTGIASSSLIGEVEIRPEEQCRLTLGIFNDINIPRGFIVNTIPNSRNTNIRVELMELNHKGLHKILIDITNLGDKPISLELRQIKEKK